MIPRLVIAGTHSGVGKTTFTVGLCGALRRMGLCVSAFKCGPDYLDPTWHFRAAGVRSQNLDGWMMGREAVLATFHNTAKDSDIALIEGVMGLFDGADATSEIGSTAEIAKWLGAPVLLVVDAAGMSRSVAAMASGFASFDPDLRVGGVLCNRVGSRGHLDLLRQASRLVPVLGGLPRNPTIAFPERHLELHAAAEASVPSDCLDTWAELVATWCDVKAIGELARNVTALQWTPPVSRKILGGQRCRIGLAVDEAFHFYYDENLRLLREFGAELIEFSPMRDEKLPDVDGLYLGGGYPELHARALTENKSLRQQIQEFCHADKPVYAECGGLMYLCSGIRFQTGSFFPMVGVFPAEAVMSDKLQALGYVEATIQRNCIMGATGQRFRGHQFRYSTLEWEKNVASAYTLTKRRRGEVVEEGYLYANVLGSYVHAHWASNPTLPEHFVRACLIKSSVFGE